MTTTCVVTGGAGFIGCAISEGLLKRFDRVIAIDNLHPQVHVRRDRPERLAKAVELIVADVTERRAWDEILPRCSPTVIVHLAAETGTAQSLTEASRHALVNVLGTTVMLDALLHHKQLPNRIVLASSRAVYGEGPWKNILTGDVVYPGQRTREQLSVGNWDFADSISLPVSAGTTMAAPVSVYGATKLAQENIIRGWSSALGVCPAVLRLQNVYGPGQSLTNPYTGIIALFCQLAREKKPIPLYEDGMMLRDFVFIDDVASALLSATDVSEFPVDPLDVGTGVATSISAIAAEIAENYEAPEPKVTAQYRFGDVRHASCSIDAARRRLGWTPESDIKKGLLRLRGWIETHLSAHTARTDSAA